MNTAPKERKLVVVLMDCWDYVFAYQSTDEFLANTRRNIRTTAIKKIRDFIIKNSVDVIINASYGFPIHPKLMSFTKQKNCVEVSTIEEFADNVFFDKTPVDIYYMGAHWNACVRNKPVGWRNIQNFSIENNIDCRILFKKDTLIAEIDDRFECWPDFDNDDETLSYKINDDTWQLVTDLIDRG